MWTCKDVLTINGKVVHLKRPQQFALLAQGFLKPINGQGNFTLVNGGNISSLIVTEELIILGLKIHKKFKHGNPGPHWNSVLRVTSFQS